MVPPTRLAILECDNPLDNARKKIGSHTGAIQALFAHAAVAFGDPTSSYVQRLQISTWKIYNEDEQDYPSLDAVDAILVSGARFCAFENTPWVLRLVRFVKAALESNRIRLIGICFGHQIIARCLGAELGTNAKGWEISVSDVALTPRGSEIFGASTLSLHLLNRDMVLQSPSGVEILAYTSKTDIHSMYAAGKLITIQGHPEFTEEMSREILQLRRDAGIVDKDTFDDAFPRLSNPSNGIWVAKAFLDFLFN